jgi:hypothetical protein
VPIAEVAVATIVVRSGKTSVIPAILAYFRLICDASSESAEDLLKLSNSLLAEGMGDDVIVRFFRSRGSSFDPPYVAVEIVIEEANYDLAVWEQKVRNLFAYVGHCESNLRRARALAGVSAQMIVNTNAFNSDHRPVFLLDSTQVGLLARLKASFELDGYLMFDEEATETA